MKILLASLMCIVLGASECFAISGGPGYGGSKVRVTGTYAGVLLPPLNVIEPPVEPPPPSAEADNSLGLFTVTLPRTGIGTGIAAIFRNGLYYPGTIQATADPDSAKLYALVNATFTKTIVREETTGTTVKTLTFIFTYSANGRISDLNGVTIHPNANIFSTATARLVGKARLTFINDFDPGPDPNGVGDVVYTVVGFKQAEVP